MSNKENKNSTESKKYFQRLLRILKFEVDLGTILLGILGAIATIIITYLQINSSHEIENLRLQSSNQIEELRIQIAESELDISRSQVAAALMPLLIKGSESERIIAMIILENIGDSTLTTKIFQGLALNDPKVEIRLQAIRVLGRKGGKDIKPLLVNIGKQGKTLEERDAAKRAERNVAFRENLNNANAFYTIARWQEADSSFYKASLAVDSTLLTKEDKNKLTAAKIFMETKSFKDAAKKYNDVFSRFN